MKAQTWDGRAVFSWGNAHGLATKEAKVIVKVLDKFPVWKDLEATIKVSTFSSSNRMDHLYKLAAFSLSVTDGSKKTSYSGKVTGGDIEARHAD